MENEKKPVLKKANQGKSLKPDKDRRSETLMNVRLTKEEKALLKKEYSNLPFGKRLILFASNYLIINILTTEKSNMKRKLQQDY